jgi:hypothetical protein
VVTPTEGKNKAVSSPRQAARFIEAGRLVRSSSDGKSSMTAGVISHLTSGSVMSSGTPKGYGD